MSPEVTSRFDALDTKKAYLKTQKAGAQRELLSSHVVKLPRGVLPQYAQLTALQQTAWKMFGPKAEVAARMNQKLEDDMLKAHMRIRPEEYIAFVWFVTMIVGIALSVTGVVLGIVLALVGNLIAGIIIAVVLPVLGTILTYFVMLSRPSSIAKSRARDIDRKISPAMSFVSAMASADVNIDVIFKELARQPIYGEIKEEAGWITRDTELLGVDILTAIKKGATRTPSAKFQDFLQGVVTTTTSGGQLKPYFLTKAEQYEKEAKLEMSKRLETLGMLAETFVTVVVAFPLFLVIIMAIMALVGGQGRFILNILYAIVFLMIPLSQFGFIFVIWNMSQE
ncbi:MAG: type II secretion system F family protein [Thermoplasmata archaeon]|nr:type II secretion system F family protein [Thermoplasmata archaeon]